MSEEQSHLSAHEMAELSALADGTLPPERRAAVEALVAESPALRELVDRQRRAVAATRPLANEPVPPSLRSEVERRAPGERRDRRWRAPRLALGGAVAVAAAVLLVVLVVAPSGGPAGPSVADAAQLATLPPNGPAPARLGQSWTQLAARVDGVVFPDLLRRYGWRPVGLRHDRLSGRNATTVFYRKGGRRIAYVIVAGPGLSRPTGAPTLVRRGVELQTLRVGGRQAVTWQRLGHTCVLIGAAKPTELRLATWRGGGSLRY